MKAGSPQPGGVLPDRQVTVGHLRAGDLGGDPRELVQVEGRAGELSSPAPGAHDGDHIRCGHATGQQLLNRETPKMARSSGDSVGRHSHPFYVAIGLRRAAALRPAAPPHLTGHHVQ